MFNRFSRNVLSRSCVRDYTYRATYRYRISSRCERDSASRRLRINTVKLVLTRATFSFAGKRARDRTVRESTESTFASVHSVGSAKGHTEFHARARARARAFLRSVIDAALAVATCSTLL